MIDWPDAVIPFIKAIEHKPDFPRRLVHMARSMRSKLTVEQAAILCFNARRLAPQDAHVWSRSSAIIKSYIPKWHGKLVNDHDRNAAYENGIKAALQPGMTVLEIGTGSGILAMLAARAGARHVYTIEANRVLAAIARDNIARNGYADRITVIEGLSSDITVGPDLPEPCDMLVQEIIANNVVGERSIAFVSDAKRRLLKPDAVLVPNAVSAIGRLIDHDHGWGGCKQGLDLSTLDLVRPAVGSEDGNPRQVLSRPEVLFRLDYAADEMPPLHRHIRIPVSHSGMVTAVEQWIRIEFGGGIVYENPPLTPSSWTRRTHGLFADRTVEPGDRVRLRIDIDEPHLWVALDDEEIA